MIFDSWGGALADGAYQAFSLAYMQKVVAKLQREKQICDLREGVEGRLTIIGKRLLVSLNGSLSLLP